MLGYRFYADYSTKELKRKGGNAPNCIALFLNDNKNLNYYYSNGEAMYEGLAAIFDSANSPVNVTGISASYLAECCKRISESRARSIHTELFNRLDN